MKFSVVIPAHNEEKIIEKTIKSVIKELKGCNCEIIAVDDNSNDSTGRILDSLSKKYRNVKTVHKISRKVGPTGLGSSLTFGFKHAKGEIFVPFMGDLSDSPKDILKLVKKIEEGYDVVCGSRFLENSSIEGYPPVKMFVNRLWNNVFGFLFGLEIKDISNAFKAYRRSVVKAVKPKSKGFDITAEIAFKAYILGFRIVEVPVSWDGRRKGESKFGSFSPIFVLTKLPKIGYQYGMLALKLWFRFLFQRVTRFFKS